jgi:membrane-associated phospholipid phosphatase
MAEEKLTRPLFKYLSKKDCIVLSVLALIILIVGIILITLGYNEAFYVPNPTVRKIVSLFTEVGSEEAYVALLAIFLFMIDWKMGKGLFVQFMINSFFNSFLKDVFKDPRPQWNETPDGPIEDSYGLPSGHAQNAVGFWGYLLFWKKNTEESSLQRTIFFIVALFFLIILPISRLIIGVHDVEDVFGGLCIGIVILMVYLLVLPYLAPIKQKPMIHQIFLGVALVLTAWVIVLVAVPDATEGIGQAAGLLLAAAIALPIEEKYIGFDPRMYSPIKRIIAGLIGVVITFAFYFGLGAIFKLLPYTLNWLWRFIRYIILGLILILGVPAFLRKTIKT